MKYTKDYTSYEQYNYRNEDELPFTAAPHLEYDDKPVPMEHLYEDDRNQGTSKPLKIFKIKFVWSYREGAKNWQEHELNITAKSIKQACFKVHEKLKHKRDLVFYKITGTWEVSFPFGGSSVFDLKQVTV